jgi:hypothetical protein
MGISFWRDVADTRNRWAVMDGPSLQDEIIGHILDEDGTWRIENDSASRAFLNYQSAGAALAGQELLLGYVFYRVVRGEEVRSVMTTEEGLEIIKQNGWVGVATLSPLHHISN